MADQRLPPGMVGPFWVVEAGGQAAVIAVAVPLERADAYGDMLTVDTGHLEHWSGLARRGAGALREAGIPTAPVWSEYEEWPRGRMLYDCAARRFVVRADRRLHRPEFMRLIADRFGIAVAQTAVLPDDHYRSIRSVPLPLVE
jgi:hypothetical protein